MGALDAYRRRLQVESDRALAMLHGSTNQYHLIYAIEAPKAGQDPDTGLPQLDRSQVTVTQLLPAPRVIIGAATILGPGGAQETVGDAQVWHIDTATWPLARLMAARAFLIDATDYRTAQQWQLMTGHIRERGHGTNVLILAKLAKRVVS